MSRSRRIALLAGLNLTAPLASLILWWCWVIGALERAAGPPVPR